MAVATTIKVFLVKGDPAGLRIAEISSWTGIAVAGPRSDLSSLLSRRELNAPGVYILSGEDPESGQPAVYVGEAERVRTRLPHHAKKDYWSQAFVFAAKDSSLTKAHVKYLEGKLIEVAIESAHAKVINTQTSQASLPESDEAEMSVFLEKALQLMPILGLGAFRKAGKTSSGSPQLFCKIKGLVAKGRRTSSGFVVYKGSQAVAKDRPAATRTIAHRQALIEKGVLTKSDNCFVFTQNYEFSSPSAAGGVIRGGNTNGLTSWKTRDGVPLKELEQPK